MSANSLVACITVSQMNILRLHNYGKMPAVFTTPIIKAVLYSNTLDDNFSQMDNSQKSYSYIRVIGYNIPREGLVDLKVFDEPLGINRRS